MLEDGQTYHLSIGGYGEDKNLSILSMTRKADRILANTSTCVPENIPANCI
jgi:hypothetical protein